MAQGNRIRASNAVDIVEAAYHLDGSEMTWLEGIVEQTNVDLDTESGLYAFTGDESVPNLAKTPAFVERRLSPEIRARLEALNASTPTAMLDLLKGRLVTCGGLVQVLGADSPVVAHFREHMESAGAIDGFCMFAQDAEGGSLTIAAPTRVHIAPSPRVRGIWQRVGLHLVAGLRLRRKLASHETRRAALLSPSGTIEDASEDVAKHGAACRALADAVRAMDRARTSEMRASPERALELWRGLVAGQWSLVDHWEHGGRRYVAAYPNRPGMRDPRALSKTEQAVLRYVELGATNKEASYALGVSEKTVTECVTRILRKFRVRSRVELAGLIAATRSTRLDVPLADERIGVLAIDVAPTETSAVTSLTVAERDVAEHVARGWSNARIAASRRVSVSTVAKQLRLIFDKLGVDNRSQLARAVAQGNLAEPQ